MNLPKLQVRLYGDPCLRQKSTPVKEVGPAERMLMEAMIQTMYDYKGIGLAAPQVGINQRFFVVDVGEGPRVFVNPKILKSEGESVVEEGCLSIPEIQIPITRPQRILVQYTDENNETHEEGFDELMARVIQHESDHLDGRLIVDFTTEAERKKLQAKLDKIQNENT